MLRFPPDPVLLCLFPPVQRNLSDLIPFFDEMPKECHFSLATLKHHVEYCGCLQVKETHSEKVI